MLRKLHLQMTFFCMLVTSLILIGMTCVSLYISEAGIWKNSYASFKNNVSTTLSYLDQQTLLSHQWIAQMKANYGFVIDIRDNGTPLFFQALNEEDYPQDVLEQVTEIVEEQYSLDLDSSVSSTILYHVEFSLTAADKTDYYVSFGLVPKGSGFIIVIILYPLTGELTRIVQQRILFLLVNLAAIIVLAIFSWCFTKRLIKPIAESRRRQTQFIASASHELRSPLTVILSSLSAMKIATPEEAVGFSETIQTEGVRMSRLISDMLVLANADNGTWSIHSEKVELDTLLLQTYEKYTALAHEKQLTLLAELPNSTAPVCYCDGERVAQVLSILIDNAFSYTPGGGTVTLSLTEDQGKAVLRVSDNGPGISDEDKEYIFERFYRADKAHKSKSHFGLGLCIANEIVRLHKGKLRITDTPGGGATFSVILPV